MANVKFRAPVSGPAFLSAEPQKVQAPEKVIDPGLDHRPFTQDEIKQAFDTFDLDNNRFVGAMEIRHILDILGEEATDEEIDEMIRMCDNDGDGQVTFDEFQKMMTQPPPPPPPPLPTKIAQIKEKRRVVRQAVQNLDRDRKKGKRDMSTLDAGKKKQRAESIEALIKRLSGGTSKIKASQIKKIYKRFQDIDLDKSGAVDYEEFIRALEMDDSTISRQMFKVFDMDDSGTVDLKEFIVVLSRYTEASKAEKLKFAFMMFDEDGSGVIERHEIIEMLSATFVVEGLSNDELEEKADLIYEALELPPDGVVGYHDFLKLANDRRALMYPIEEKQFTHPGKAMS